jgi:hypothetical protein
MGQEGGLAGPRWGEGGTWWPTAPPPSFSPTLRSHTLPIPFLLYTVEARGEKDTHINLSRPPCPGCLSLAISLLSVDPWRSAHGGSQLHLVRGSVAGIPIQKMYFHNHSWIKRFRSLCQHRTCANLRGATLAALDVVRGGLNKTLRSATSTTTSTMF